MLVVWGDEEMQLLKNVPINKPLTLWQRDVLSGKIDYEKYFPKQQAPLENVTDVAQWQHHENPFNDFNVQGLIPHEQSTKRSQDSSRRCKWRWTGRLLCLRRPWTGRHVDDTATIRQI